MNWHYTDGHLTLRVEGEEHKFSLEELISSSYVYKDIIKKVQKINGIRNVRQSIEGK